MKRQRLYSLLVSWRDVQPNVSTEHAHQLERIAHATSSIIAQRRKRLALGSQQLHLKERQSLHSVLY
jgi:hypothetical protein